MDANELQSSPPQSAAAARCRHQRSRVGVSAVPHVSRAARKVDKRGVSGGRRVDSSRVKSKLDRASLVAQVSFVISRLHETRETKRAKSSRAR